MRLHRLPLLLAVAAVAIASASAEEILHFSNGTTMVIRNHEVVDGMIRVDLGSNAFVAFPADRVEKITEAGKDVYLSPSFGANVAVGRRTSAGAPAYGTATVPSRYRNRSGGRGQEDGASAVDRLLAGQQPNSSLGVMRTNRGNPSPAARRIGVVGRQSIYRAGENTPHRDYLPRAVNGEMKIPDPLGSGGPASNRQVSRFLPNPEVVAAAAAEARNVEDPAAPSAAGEEGGQGSGD